MHSSKRRRTVVTAVSAVSLGLMVAGCGTGGSGPGATTDVGGQDVLLQPVAAHGPDPFTQSTAKTTTPLPSTTTPAPTRTASVSPSASVRRVQQVSGGTPGLYGGTQSVSSCDVEQQIRYLTGSGADQAKARAFADASRIDVAAIPRFLRGLTPVVLRADTRVTNHGFSGGSLTSFQSVLQAGTAVMVDANGMPRVRCACGNPLLPPTVAQGTVTHKGQPWRGYRPAEVVVVTPTTVVINNLTIVNVVNNTWIERETGSEGEKDKTPPPDAKLPPPPPPDELGDERAGEPQGNPEQAPGGDEEKTPGTIESGTTEPGTTEPGSTEPGTADTPDESDTPAQSDAPSDTPSESTSDTDSPVAPPPPTTPCPTLTPGVPTPATPLPVPSGCPTPTPSHSTALQLPSDPDSDPEWDAETQPGPDGG
ncbi:hypothetical protein GCM10010329_56860 [Streptomyces spiroverticillatus]|uniref:DUF6777 domain-containing protein n=1 Tax=Streptomyces finlayi TaxID=67296 RepID=A0A918X3X0_9ACTN|nr:DUF6777 domain-containing protein [Streptomyces finlayi]GHA26300.1 hypothetical protein GCM10010329_56860 [Streptomyces spiroverticillatus]GHD07845.1 hypothetical protein GCM10010334_60530 [Streptomyces finlayi]